MDNKLMLLGFLDNFSEKENAIIDEFYSARGRNINLTQKKIITQCYYDYFDVDFWKDKLVYAQQFKSKTDGRNYIIVKMPCDVALFECE